MASRLARSLLLPLCVAAAATRSATAADACTELGIPAPAVTTVIAAPNDTANSAWIVRPDCSMEFQTLAPAANGDLRLNCSKREIRHIQSLPTAIQRLDLDENPIAEDVVFDLSHYTAMGHIILAWCNLTSVDNFKFPAKLYVLDLDGNHIQGVAIGTLPEKLPVLYLSRNKITSMDNFSLPDSLGSLNLHNNSLTALNFTLPTEVQEVHLDGNTKITAIENVTMPSTLTSFTCSNCSIETFRGVQISSALKTLDLRDSKLKEFEVRESDAAGLKLVDFSGTVDQTTCKDPSAKLEQLKPNLAACVISDAAFKAKYMGGSVAPKTSNVPSTPAPTSSSSSSKTTVVAIATAVAVVLSVL